MLALAALALLTAEPPAELVRARQLLFETSDAATAAKLSDGLVAAHPDSADALELSYIAHWMMGDDAVANQRYAVRARLGDVDGRERVLLDAWRRLPANRADADALQPAIAELVRARAPRVDAALIDALSTAERMRGHFDQARAAEATLARIAHWSLIGPFENRDNSGFEAAFAPERSVDFAAHYPGVSAPVGWREVAALDENGRISLLSVMYPNQAAVAYLVSWVQAPQDLDVLLSAEAPDRLKVWVNDRLAVSDEGTRAEPFEPADPQGAGVRLHRGWNKILLKTTHLRGSWNVAIRLARADGSPLELPSSAATRPYTPAGKEAWGSRPRDPVLDGLGHDQVWNAPAAYWTAWRLYDLRAFRRARALFEALARAHPQCALYAHGAAVAAWHDDDRDDALAGLTSAGRLDPAFSGAFVDRARIYVDMQLLERAQEVLETALRTRPESAPALEELGEVLRARGFGPAARTAFEHAGRVHPVDSVFRQLGSLELEDQNVDAAMALAGQADGLQAESAAEGEFLMLEMLGRHEEAIAFEEGRLRRHPVDLSLHEQIARVAITQRKDALALGHLARMRVLCPQWDAPDRWEALLAEKRGDLPRALALYRSALRLEPNQPQVRDRLEMLDPAAAEIRRFDVSHEEVLRSAAAVSQATYPRASAVQLLDQEVWAMQPDGSSRIYRHLAVKVLDQAGVDRYVNVKVERSNAKILYAATVASSGAEHEISSIDDGVIHFPGLAPGAVVEAWYRYDDSARGTYWWWLRSFGGVDPVKREEWVVVSPPEKPLKFKTSGRFEESTVPLGGRTAHVFRRWDIPALVAEPALPPWIDVMDTVYASGIAGWEDVASLVHGAVDGQINDDDSIRAKALELTRETRTPEERVSALAVYVSKDVRYVQADVNLYEWNPHPARRVLEAGYGDCKDKATLFIALARQVGVEARFAVLSTHSQGRAPDGLPTLFFNHAIAYLPPQEGVRPRFLDLTAADLSPELLPIEDQNAQALVISPNRTGFELKRIPPSRAADAVTVIRTRGVLAADGSATAQVEYQANGIAASDARGNLRDPASRKTTVDKLAGHLLFHGASAGPCDKVDGLDTPTRPVELKVDISVPVAMRPSGSAWLLHPGGFPDFSELAAAKRVFPVDMRSDVEWEIHRQWTLPEGFDVSRLPAAGHVDSPYLRMEISYRANGRTIEIDSKYARTTRWVAPQEYPALKKAIAAIQALEEADVVLAAPAAGATR